MSHAFRQKNKVETPNAMMGPGQQRSADHQKEESQPVGLLSLQDYAQGYCVKTNSPFFAFLFA